jgi:hypothetical protein
LGKFRAARAVIVGAFNTWLLVSSAPASAFDGAGLFALPAARLLAETPPRAEGPDPNVVVARAETASSGTTTQPARRVTSLLFRFVRVFSPTVERRVDVAPVVYGLTGAGVKVRGEM